jgi:glycosyltransferase involved in cell wall biosynthesis
MDAADRSYFDDVTVVIPAVSARFLRPCLASLIGQTFGGWQAIVVADGSEQELIGAEVASFSDSRFSLMRHGTNRGPAASRNTAIGSSGTGWIAAVDADDVLSPRFLEALLEAARATPAAEAFFGDFEWIGDRTGRVRWAAQDLEAFLAARTIPGAGVLYRRSVWERAGGYCESELVAKAGIEDFEFWLKALKAGVRVAHVDEVLYGYRRHAGSLTTTPNPDYHRARAYVHSLHRELFELHRAGGRYLADGHWRAVADNYGLERRRRAIAHGVHAVAAGRTVADAGKLGLLVAACAARSPLPRRLQW